MQYYYYDINVLTIAEEILVKGLLRLPSLAAVFVNNMSVMYWVYQRVPRKQQLAKEWVWNNEFMSMSNIHLVGAVATMFKRKLWLWSLVNWNNWFELPHRRCFGKRENKQQFISCLHRIYWYLVRKNVLIIT